MHYAGTAGRQGNAARHCFRLVNFWIYSFTYVRMHVYFLVCIWWLLVLIFSGPCAGTCKKTISKNKTYMCSGDKFTNWIQRRDIHLRNFLIAARAGYILRYSHPQIDDSGKGYIHVYRKPYSMWTWSPVDTAMRS